MNSAAPRVRADKDGESDTTVVPIGDGTVPRGASSNESPGMMHGNSSGNLEIGGHFASRAAVSIDPPSLTLQTEQTASVPAAGDMEDESDDDGTIPMVRRGHKWRRFEDGCGRCSPGRRYPDQRPTPRLLFVGEIMKEVLQSNVDASGADAVSRMQAMLASGNKERFAAPWTEDALKQARSRIAGYLSGGSPSQLLLEVPEGQPFLLRLLYSMSAYADDPDADVIPQYAVGPPMGVQEELPRTPEMFAPKVKWSLDYSEEVPRDAPLLYKKRWS